MFTCLILVALLPSALSVATLATVAIGAMSAPPTYPVARPEDAPLHVTDPIVAVESARYSGAPSGPSIGWEYDRRGRVLPPRDTRGRFIRRA